MTTEEHQAELAFRAEAANSYLHETTRTYQRAVEQGFLTGEAAVNTLLAAASLIASATMGPAAPGFLEQRVADLASAMRGKSERAN